MPNAVVNCCFCGNVAPSTKEVNVLILVDKEKVYELEISQVVWMLEDYFKGKYTHLSMTEIILYRKDILQEALKEYFTDMEKFSIGTVPICDSCYEEFLKDYPLV